MGLKNFVPEADLGWDMWCVPIAGGLCACVAQLEWDFDCFSDFLACVAHDRYGVGYHMTIAKGPDCQDKRVTDFILNLVPEAQLSTSAGAELAYILPNHAAPAFPKLFEQLEGKLALISLDLPRKKTLPNPREFKFEILQQKDSPMSRIEKAILACNPALSTEWLDWVAISCGLWHIRTGVIDLWPRLFRHCCIRRLVGLRSFLKIVASVCWTDYYNQPQAILEQPFAAFQMSLAEGLPNAVLLPNQISFPFLYVADYQKPLGINSFGMSVTTMEEVFLQVGRLAEAEGDKWVLFICLQVASS